MDLRASLANGATACEGNTVTVFPMVYVVMVDCHQQTKGCATRPLQTLKVPQIVLTLLGVCNKWTMVTAKVRTVERRLSVLA